MGKCETHFISYHHLNVWTMYHWSVGVPLKGIYMERLIMSKRSIRRENLQKLKPSQIVLSVAHPKSCLYTPDLRSSPLCEGCSLSGQISPCPGRRPFWPTLGIGGLVFFFPACLFPGLGIQDGIRLCYYTEECLMTSDFLSTGENLWVRDSGEFCCSKSHLFKVYSQCNRNEFCFQFFSR